MTNIADFIIRKHQKKAININKAIIRIEFILILVEMIQKINSCHCENLFL